MFLLVLNVVVVDFDVETVVVLLVLYGVVVLVLNVVVVDFDVLYVVVVLLDVANVVV